MGKHFIKFINIIIKKQKFHSSKSAVTLHDVDIYKIVLSKKFTFGKNKEMILIFSAAIKMKNKLRCLAWLI